MSQTLAGTVALVVGMLLDSTRSGSCVDWVGSGGTCSTSSPWLLALAALGVTGYAFRRTVRARRPQRRREGADFGEDARMEWSVRNRERLEIALTEAEVAGVRHRDPDSLALLIHVSALPERGPMDQDARRVLVLRGVTRARFLLRRLTVEGNGPAISIPSLAFVDEFFESLAQGGAMYGWRYFDAPELTADWPDTPSLVVDMSHLDPPHLFYWFNECARVEDGEIHSYCIEGTAAFEDLTVECADGTELPTELLADEGVRWWQAFQDLDERVDYEAQRAWLASRITWRSWPGIPAPAH